MGRHGMPNDPQHDLRHKHHNGRRARQQDAYEDDYEEWSDQADYVEDQADDIDDTDAADSDYDDYAYADYIDDADEAWDEDDEWEEPVEWGEAPKKIKTPSGRATMLKLSVRSIMAHKLRLFHDVHRLTQRRVRLHGRRHVRRCGCGHHPGPGRDHGRGGPKP